MVMPSEVQNVFSMKTYFQKFTRYQVYEDSICIMKADNLKEIVDNIQTQEIPVDQTLFPPNEMLGKQHWFKDTITGILSKRKINELTVVNLPIGQTKGTEKPFVNINQVYQKLLQHLKFHIILPELKSCFAFMQ